MGTRRKQAPKASFVLLELEDSRAKSIRSILGSTAARRILDGLGHGARTESELARSLGMPLSTVHHYTQQLRTSGLIKSDEYHYSSKGREVAHYTLANTYIVIAPGAGSTALAHLKSIVPVLLGIAAIGLLLQFMTLQAPAAHLAQEAAGTRATALAQPLAAPQNSASLLPPIPPAAWFVLGAIVAIAAYILFEWLRARHAR